MLKLGELKQLLQDPTVVFQNVKFLGRTELRGQIVTHDAVSETADNPQRNDFFVRHLLGVEPRN